MSDSNRSVALLLRSARLTGVPIPRDVAPDLDAATGHAVQAAGRAMHVAEGERVAGRKAGLTSAAAQAPMSADEPVTGYLLESMISPIAAEFDCSRLLSPRVEVEIAFVLARGLEGPDLAPSDVLAATAHLALAIEVVDSRWEGGPAGVGPLLADDVSAAAVLVGPTVDPAAADLLGLRVTAQVGEVGVTGDAGNVLGDPARAVAWLCADLHRRGEGLQAGDLVLSGAMCGPTPVRAGDAVRADFGDLGRLETVFVA